MRKLSAFLAFLAVIGSAPAHAQSQTFIGPLQAQLIDIANSNPGNIGVAALDLTTGQTVSVYGDQPFPMASVVKVAIAANYMSQVEAGRRSLDTTIAGQSARSLIGAMLIHSDNRATDLILNNLGGPTMVQAWIDQHGIAGIHIDRTIARLLADRRDLNDRRDSSTPNAMIALLKKLDTGALVRPQSRSFILDLMARCETGKNRMRALLPGVKVEHKTGTLNGLTNDVGYMTLPNGHRVAVAIFARQGTNRPATIAAAARAIYDGFANFFIAPWRSVPTGSAAVGAAN